MDDPQRFTRLLVMNTVLATGKRSLGEGFFAWRAWVNANPDLRVGALMQRSCRHLTGAEAAAYDAPFPDQRFKAGARRFRVDFMNRKYSPQEAKKIWALVRALKPVPGACERSMDELG